MDGEYGARIELGTVLDAEDGAYRVMSYDRYGIVTDWIKPINGTDDYDAGDRVYFFVFADGRGRIIGAYD